MHKIIIANFSIYIFQYNIQTFVCMNNYKVKYIPDVLTKFEKVQIYCKILAKWEFQSSNQKLNLVRMASLMK